MVDVCTMMSAGRLGIIVAVVATIPTSSIRPHTSKNVEEIKLQLPKFDGAPTNRQPHQPASALNGCKCVRVHVCIIPRRTYLRITGGCISFQQNAQSRLLWANSLPVEPGLKANVTCFICWYRISAVNDMYIEFEQRYFPITKQK